MGSFAAHVSVDSLLNEFPVGDLSYITDQTANASQGYWFVKDDSLVNK